ncbi:transcriptional regulator NrdR [Patescibacteria group bacterium]|nr:transcriptional regulator NrdR [Patescibacteria group bacterium]MBU1016463.1 transcriptional regulator NrdR [Patescibacteria group bacterium]MBU1684961.1 transcriptional regulator NrdR [Patescibacteria group bacterium]MBU1939011.1 transcriptional regulator NrdR [Patescibacteria group bacterium]
MNCPKCKAAETKVVDSRVTENGRVIRRRRECEKCESRFTTFERAAMGNLMVKKKDGTYEIYNRNKLEQGIWIACGKRPVTKAQIDEMINDLEDKWASNKETVASQTIGNDVMEALKKLDHIAYIRFASVYRSFKDVDEFKEELNKLLS